MPSMSRSRYAGVLAHHDDKVVLVYEEYPRWGGPYWNIPSGRIEDNETPFQGARRELAEETGLVVATADLVLHGTAAVTGAVTVSRVWNFTVDVVDPTLHVRDPDGLVQEARWFPFEEASRLLHELPYRPLSEPSAVVLTRQARPGAHWAYSDPKRSRLSPTPTGEGHLPRPCPADDQDAPRPCWTVATSPADGLQRVRLPNRSRSLSSTGSAASRILIRRLRSGRRFDPLSAWFGAYVADLGDPPPA